MEPFGTEYEVIELTMRVLCDVRASTCADVAYLFSETDDNAPSIFATGARLMKEAVTSRIAILGRESLPGQGSLPCYAGHVAWQEELIKRGIEPFVILEIQPPLEVLAHTQTEAIALVQHAKDAGWKAIYIVASPFHLLRAMVDTITIVLRNCPNLKVYAVVGTTQSWVEEALHSQGVVRGRRYELIGGELDRIDCYYRKGDLATLVRYSTT